MGTGAEPGRDEGMGGAGWDQGDWKSDGGAPRRSANQLLSSAPLMQVVGTCFGRCLLNPSQALIILS